MVVDLVSQLHFFIRAAMGLGIGKTVGLSIGRAILMETDVAVGFFRLFLW